MTIDLIVESICKGVPISDMLSIGARDIIYPQMKNWFDTMSSVLGLSEENLKHIFPTNEGLDSFRKKCENFMKDKIGDNDLSIKVVKDIFNGKIKDKGDMDKAVSKLKKKVNNWG